jgi:hypothetical protein
MNRRRFFATIIGSAVVATTKSPNTYPIKVLLTERTQLGSYSFGFSGWRKWSDL